MARAGAGGQLGVMNVDGCCGCLLGMLMHLGSFVGELLLLACAVDHGRWDGVGAVGVFLGGAEGFELVKVCGSCGVDL